MKKKLDLRILQIDLGRQKETVAYLKSYIDFAKENGYNAVLLYLEATVKVACTSFFKDDESYTPDEIREIVAYGNEKGIDIIPALENLAHVENFLRHSELRFLSECQDAAVDGRGIRAGLGDCTCVSNPKAMKFMDTYYSQVIPLFTSPYVHTGMDEPFDFAVCPRCTERLQNGETKQDLFYKHLMRTYELVKSFGKTMMMWDDFFQYMDVVEKLPRDIILCCWNYTYITDEPQGFWLNRKKKDWLRYYDQLGFRYLFCTFANRTSKLFNVDSFTAYAGKYHPTGALMTAWCRSNIFYHCSYPAIAYAGRLWSGKAKEEDRIKIYTQLLGSREAAEVVLKLEAGDGSYQPRNLQICENMTQGSYNAIYITEYALDRMKELLAGMEDGLQKDILGDIYSYTLTGYIGLRLHKLCIEAFDNYESRSKRPAYFVKQLEQLKEMNRQIYAHGKYMWEKYRPGIRSFQNDLENSVTGREKSLDRMIAELTKQEKHGVFYAELMLHSVWGTPRIVIEINYKDKSIPATVYRTNPKVAGGVNTIRFAMENKPIDHVVLTLTGEGACYPCHFRYTCGGKKYVVSSVTKQSGDARDLKHILCDDTQFAQLGNDDGQAHFEDVNLSKVEHKIKLKFKRMK